MIHPVNPERTKPFKTIAHTTYEGVYSSDLQRSAKWYYKAFGFYITIMNQDFAIVEMMPGRILCISTLIKKPMKVGFITKNMNALKRQLIKENIPFELEEENQLKVQDPDGNTIVIRSSGYGVENLKAFAPEQTFRWRTRVRLETRDEMHLIAKKI
ncbi:MAG: hypothetical protein K0R75_2497, partial [Paenibacillaceae bacterium]|nr:hypothetical protein [Paenibacillaceae bacterium]